MTHLELADTLALTPAHLRQLLTQVDDSLAQWRPKSDAWCINEIIGHLIWTDQHAFADRIKLMTEQDGSELPLIDVNKAARKRQDHLKPLAGLLDEFTAARADSVTFVRGLEPSTLANSASYKARTWLASDFLYEWPFHDYGHIAQIMRNLRANLAPYMSDTMRTAVGY